MITPGTRAPEITLAVRGGNTVRLADFRGHKTVVLYFYPKDFTLGCTVEACSFRDSYEDFVGLGAEVIGVSSDSVDSHDGFAKKHQLPFILASDRDGSAARAFGVDASFFGLMKGRVTFVIDKDGIVRDAFNSQIRAKTHVERALALVRSLEQGDPVTPAP
jgi:thioredoxin-dependent peroxiredoxin